MNEMIGITRSCCRHPHAWLQRPGAMRPRAYLALLIRTLSEDLDACRAHFFLFWFPKRKDRMLLWALFPEPRRLKKLVLATIRSGAVAAINFFEGNLVFSFPHGFCANSVGFMHGGCFLLLLLLLVLPRSAHNFAVLPAATVVARPRCVRFHGRLPDAAARLQRKRPPAAVALRAAEGGATVSGGADSTANRAAADPAAEGRDAARDRALARRNRRLAAKATDPTQRGWYKKRHRPITRAQKGALRRHWPALGVDLRFNETLDLERYHAGAAGGGQEKSPSPHTILDVGFGKGEDLVRSERAGCRICMSAIHTHTLVRSERARCRVRMHVTHTHTHTHTNAQVQMSGLLPHAFLLGIEIHRASIATAVAALAAAGRRNVRVCRGDLTLLLRQHLRPESLDEVWVFFPDPWLAQGDAGRRVLRHETVALMHRCLRARGQVRQP